MASRDELRLQPYDGAVESIFNKSFDHKEMVSKLKTHLTRNRDDGRIFVRPDEIKDMEHLTAWNAASVAEIFDDTQKQPDGKISLDNFCDGYVSQYRAIYAKFKEIKEKIEKVEVELNSAQMALTQAQSTERLNPDTGIMQNEHGGSLGRLEVTLVDARNLASMDYSGTSDPFVKLSVEFPEGENADGSQVICGEPSEQKSQIKWKDLNPRWDEAFFFKPIYRKDGVLVIRVFDKDPVLSDELMGMATIPFETLLDQLKHDVWKELKNDPNHVSNNPTKAKGSIHVKAQFLYSQVEYFLGCVRRDSTAKNQLENEKREMSRILSQLRSPFAENRKVSPTSPSRGAASGKARVGGWSMMGNSMIGGGSMVGDTIPLMFGSQRQSIPQHQCFWCTTRCIFVLMVLAAVAVVLGFTFSFGSGENQDITVPGEVRRLRGMLLD